MLQRLAAALLTLSWQAEFAVVPEALTAGWQQVGDKHLCTRAETNGEACTVECCYWTARTRCGPTGWLLKSVWVLACAVGRGSGGSSQQRFMAETGRHQSDEIRVQGADEDAGRSSLADTVGKSSPRCISGAVCCPIAARRVACQPASLCCPPHIGALHRGTLSVQC